MKRLVYSILFLIVGAVLFQGFQCETREMNSARNYINRGEYTKAIESLNTEIQKNPSNIKAYVMLSETKSYLKDYKGAAEAILKAKENAKTPQDKSEITSYIVRLREKFQSEVLAKYNKYNATDDKQYLDSAIYLSEVSTMLRPKMAVNYAYYGNLVIERGDTLDAIAAYEKYIEMLQPEIDFAKKHGIYIGAPLQKLIDAVGASDKNFSTRDSVRFEIYEENDKYIYVHSEIGPSGEFELVSWKVDPPEEWSINEKLVGDELFIGALNKLVRVQYMRGEYEAVLETLNLISFFDPNDSATMESIIQVYTELGRDDEALTLLKEFTQKDPGNKYYWNIYGNLLLTKNQYKEAIEKFEKALQIDPEFDIALANIAFVYVKLAENKSAEEEEKEMKDPNYKPDTDSYMPFLETAAEYLEKAIKTETFKMDYNKIKELAMIYHYTDNQEKLDEKIATLERLEYMIPSSEKDQYYKVMINLMGAVKEEEKLNKYIKKLENSAK